MPKVAIVGHSFVRRFKDQLDQVKRPYKDQLDVSNYVDSIYLHGKGGALTDQILSKFSPLSTDILILDLGTNDLCGTFDGETLANKVSTYLDDYMRDFHRMKSVYIFEIVERERTRNVSKAKFDFERKVYNSKIQEIASSNPKITFCKHVGLNDMKKWSNDGIHPDTRFGTNQYMNNVRNVILKATKRQ